MLFKGPKSSAVSTTTHNTSLLRYESGIAPYQRSIWAHFDVTGEKDGERWYKPTHCWFLSFSFSFFIFSIFFFSLRIWSLWLFLIISVFLLSYFTASWFLAFLHFSIYTRVELFGFVSLCISITVPDTVLEEGDRFHLLTPFLTPCLTAGCCHPFNSSIGEGSVGVLL